MSFIRPQKGAQRYADSLKLRSIILKTADNPQKENAPAIAGAILSTFNLSIKPRCELLSHRRQLNQLKFHIIHSHQLREVGIDVS
jgi:hypothetical protein